MTTRPSPADFGAGLFRGQRALVRIVYPRSWPCFRGVKSHGVADRRADRLAGTVIEIVKNMKNRPSS